MVERWAVAQTATPEPAHVPAGPVLLAFQHADFSRRIRGLDGLRRSEDRAPPLVFLIP